MNTRTSTALIVMLTTLAVYQSWTQWQSRGGSGTKVYIEPPIGSRLNAHAYASDGSRVEVASIDQGSCRVVVIYAPWCSASREAARVWADAVAPAAMPAGWSAMWVASVLPDSAAVRWISKVPALQLVDDSTKSIVSDMHVSAFPVYVLLDREGTVLRGGVGAPSPGGNTFKSDCTIADLVPRSRL